MKIDISKFGDLLISRPAGRDAALAWMAYSKLENATETLEFDFTHVVVLAPSWIDEFLQTLRVQLPNPFQFIPGQNSSVIESLKFVSVRS